MRRLLTCVAILFSALPAGATYVPNEGMPTWAVVDVVADGTPISAVVDTLYVDVSGTTDTTITLPSVTTNEGKQVAFASGRIQNHCPYISIEPAAGESISNWDADRHALLFATEGASYRLLATSSGWQCVAGCEWLDIDPRSVTGVQAWFDAQCGVTRGQNGSGDCMISWYGWNDLSGTGWNASGYMSLGYQPSFGYDGISRPAACGGDTYNRIYTATQRQLDGASGMAAMVVGRYVNTATTTSDTRISLMSWDWANNTRGFSLGTYPSQTYLGFCAGPRINSSACATGYRELTSVRRNSRTTATPSTGKADTSLFGVRATGTFGYRLNGSDTSSRTSVTWAGTTFATYTNGYLYLQGNTTMAIGSCLSSALLYDQAISENDYKALERMLMHRYGLAK